MDPLTTRIERLKLHNRQLKELMMDLKINSPSWPRIPRIFTYFDSSATPKANEMRLNNSKPHSTDIEEGLEHMAEGVESSVEERLILPKTKEVDQLNFCGPQIFVTIEAGIGDDKETFTVHQQVVSRHSPFFRAAFEGNFVEGRTKAMNFDDVESGIFGLLVNWVYLHEFVRGDQKRVTYLDLAKLWALADRLMMPKLQNAVMDIYTGFKDPQNLNVPAWDRDVDTPDMNVEAMVKVVKFVYESTPETAPLRALCVKTVMWILKDEEREDAEAYFERFVGKSVGMDLIREFLKIPMDNTEYMRTIMHGVELMVPEE
ncbi:hypothetical protein BDZ45DRAFT_729877 [Acephala macrosclerotiorum]|nr:hypothetical protein BDZ45DRAFT_729877 [Acephala macrosclerotiorum]